MWPPPNLRSSFVFPRSLGRDEPLFPVTGAYELFYYTHIFGAVAIVSLALASRFEVFYPIIPTWAIYFADVAWMAVFNTMKVRVKRAVVFTDYGARAISLKLEKRGLMTFGLGPPTRFTYRAGQTVFIKIPAISKLEWHPFSIASAPNDETVDFLIEKHGPGKGEGEEEGEGEEGEGEGEEEGACRALLFCLLVASGAKDVERE